MVLLHSGQDKKGEVKVAFCPTTNMLADFFTKPLQGSTFKRMQSIILNMSDTDKTSIEHRRWKNVKKNQDAASTKMQTLKRRKNNRKQE